MRVEYRSKENTALRVYTHLFCAIKRRRSLKHTHSNSNSNGNSYSYSNSIQWSKRANNETKKGANGQRNMLRGSGQAKFNCSHACIQSSKKMYVLFRMLVACRRRRYRLHTKLRNPPTFLLYIPYGTHTLRLAKKYMWKKKLLA